MDLMNKIKTAGFCLMGIVAAFAVNFVITLCFVLPNAHKYNTGDSNWLVELLYTFHASNGYEPFPSWINILITVLFGVLAGIYLMRKVRTGSYVD